MTFYGQLGWNPLLTTRSGRSRWVMDAGALLFLLFALPGGEPFVEGGLGDAPTASMFAGMGNGAIATGIIEGGDGDGIASGLGLSHGFQGGDISDGATLFAVVLDNGGEFGERFEGADVEFLTAGID